jgi:hypothetical protein
MMMKSQLLEIIVGLSRVVDFHSGGVPVVKLQCTLTVATDCIAMSIAIARGCKVVMCPIG